jgi:hypothetical protein
MEEQRLQERKQSETYLRAITPEDRSVVGIYPLKTARGAGIRILTLSTPAGLRIRRTWESLSKPVKRQGVRVVSGEANNGRGHFFVRITGLEA